ncbi:hypothetical protein [Frondihabitans australicus]|uniref:Uncharacterized protein n=1 Tax=Frondihabitans australicus TaxID=386892 RepID=A0A495ILB2_9MICO|nr:hypothetical protein [Frondihabitans australicus]RKR76510.1 hypothetical protein C8E83_3687 [Frondihabitans australicus]
MERIHYADESVLTGSEIAQGLLHYAAALARRGTSATVDIPIRKPDGTLGRASFLLGPASQMVSESEDSPYEEIVDPGLLESFASEESRLANPQAVAAEQPRAGELPDVEIDL